MDLITKLPKTKDGYDAILVVVDRLTKWTHLIPLRGTSSGQEVAKLLFDHVFSQHSLPLEIVSDRDVRWTSTFWAGLAEYMGTKQCLSSAYHPQSDGQTERMNRLLEETLRSYIDPSANDWDLHLQVAAYAINIATSSATGESPFVLNTGYGPRTPLYNLLPSFQPVANWVKKRECDNTIARECLKRAQENLIARTKGDRREIIFKPGDKVWLDTAHLKTRAPGTKKLFARFEGPFTVLDRIGDKLANDFREESLGVAYKIQLPSHIKLYPVFHVSLLKPYKERVDKITGLTVPQQGPLWVDGKLEWEVDSILNHRPTNKIKPGLSMNGQEFYVRFRGLGTFDHEWIPDANLDNCRELVAAYWLAHGTTCTEPSENY
jgi:hypothetical protein